ncbi:hypothetical protein JAF83_002982 [Citrobacter werkmanii]|nr:hypothetical protein [Citrobacter werkmanii]
MAKNGQIDDRIKTQKHAKISEQQAGIRRKNQHQTTLNVEKMSKMALLKKRDIKKTNAKKGVKLDYFK